MKQDYGYGPDPRIDEIYQEGQEAYDNGERLGSNPYKDDDDVYCRTWFKGWYDARDAAREEWNG